MKKKPETKLSGKFRAMPGLKHWPDKSKPFRLSESEIIKWIASDAEMVYELMDKAKYRGWIKYNAETNEWRGVPVKE